MQHSVCPWCKGNYRWFYRLKLGTLIAVCDGCLLVWFDPSRLDTDAVARRIDFQRLYGCKGVRGLFKNYHGGWATWDQVYDDDEWRTVLQSRAVAVWGTDPALSCL